MDEMISRTGNQLPASADLFHPVFISLPFVLACLPAAAGSNFGVLKKGLPHPQVAHPCPRDVRGRRESPHGGLDPELGP